jgi:hypothetical protein
MRGGEGLPVYTTCEQEQEIYQIQNINQIKLALVASGTKVQTAPSFMLPVFQSTTEGVCQSWAKQHGKPERKRSRRRRFLFLNGSPWCSIVVLPGQGLSMVLKRHKNDYSFQSGVEFRIN